jgi:hypothetical protein
MKDWSIVFDLFMNLARLLFFGFFVFLELLGLKLLEALVSI